MLDRTPFSPWADAFHNGLLLVQFITCHIPDSCGVLGGGGVITSELSRFLRLQQFLHEYALAIISCMGLLQRVGIFVYREKVYGIVSNRHN